MSADLLRVYLDPAEIGPTGYPYQWTNGHQRDMGTYVNEAERIPNIVRERDDHRCLRCRHPYAKGDGEWSRCDEQCRHGEPTRPVDQNAVGVLAEDGVWREAQWRILTVHHLNGIKHDCRWWNLVSLCQRCHLAIQAKVRLERPWHGEHSDWFRPFAAGWYAFAYEGVELSREEVDARIEELLDLERFTRTIFGLDDIPRVY